MAVAVFVVLGIAVVVVSDFLDVEIVENSVAPVVVIDVIGAALGLLGVYPLAAPAAPAKSLKAK